MDVSPKSQRARHLRYSALTLLRNALTGNRRWPRAFRHPEPKKNYDVVIIGGGAHGLATAYYLARNHGMRKVAVLEKGWIGGGNTGRNTTIVRSNYLLEENARLYEFSLKLWEGLTQELNFNLMLSQRGLLYLAQNDAQLNLLARLGNAMRLRGIDAELLDVPQISRLEPGLDCSRNTRHPIQGALLQRRGGIVRHDAVAWGFARAADALGVDIVQNCEVTGMRIDDGRISGVETSRGPIGAGRVGMVAAGSTSRVATLAGLKLPIESHLLQAMVSEPVKPAVNTVIISGATHVYVNQTDKGEIVMGGALDGHPSYAQRGNLPQITDIAREALSLFPSFGRLRVLRTWAGLNDMTPDGSPILGATPIRDLYLNGGWCYGGFKATPGSGWCFAQLLATGTAPDMIRPFALERFERGALLSENGAPSVPHLQ